MKKLKLIALMALNCGVTSAFASETLNLSWNRFQSDDMVLDVKFNINDEKEFGVFDSDKGTGCNLGTEFCSTQAWDYSPGITLDLYTINFNTTRVRSGLLQDIIDYMPWQMARENPGYRFENSFSTMDSSSEIKSGAQFWGKGNFYFEVGYADERPLYASGSCPAIIYGVRTENHKNTYKISLFSKAPADKNGYFECGDLKVKMKKGPFDDNNRLAFNVKKLDE